MKGIKQEITKASFSKSTLKGVIRKGFISKADLDKTNLTDYTKDKIKGVSFDLCFVRDKNLCFMLNTKTKTIYNCKDCKLNGYFDYFASQNKDWKIEHLENIHPDNLHSRGLGVEKTASQNGFTL